MGDLSRQQEAELNKLMQALSSFGQAMGANSRHAGNSFSAVREKAGTERKTESDKKTQAANVEALKQINKTLRQTNSDVELLGDEASGAASGFHSLYKDAIKASKSLSKLQDESYESADQLSGLTTVDVQRALKRLNKGLANSGSSMADMQRQQSLLLTAMQKEAETKLRGRDRQEDYYEYVDKMKDKAKDFISRLDASSQISIEGAGDINKVIAKVGQVRANIEQTFDGVDLSSFGGDINTMLDKIANSVDKVSGNDKIISAQQNAAVIAAANVTKSSGGQISDKALDDAEAGDIRALAKELAAINKVAAQTQKAFEQELKVRKSFTQELKDDLSIKLKDKLTAMASTAGKMAAIGNVASKVNNVFDEMVSFNIAQVPRSFLDVQASSVRFGVSFEEMTKIMQETKPLMAAQGPAYEKNLAALSDTYKQYGYSSKQMLAFVGPLTELAGVTGVNVRSGKEMTERADKTAAAFQSISGIMNITQEDFIRFNEKILSSDEYLTSTVGMNKEQTQKFADTVEKSAKDQLRLLGSMEKATAVMAAVQQSKKAPVLDRLKESINIKRKASFIGMDADKANRYAELHTKGEKNFTAADRDEMLALSKEMGAKEAKWRLDNAGNIPAEAIMNTMDQNLALGANITAMNATGTVVTNREKTGQILSEAEAKVAGEKSKGSAGLATASNIKNTATSLMDNSIFKVFTATIGLAATGLVSLTGFAASASAALASLTASSGAAAGGGLLEKAGDLLGGGKKGGGLLGKAGGLIGKAGPALLKGVGVAGVLGGAYGLYDSATKDSKEYGFDDVGASALSGLTTGASLGAFFGPMGAVIGGGLGATAGAVLGGVKMWNGRDTESGKTADTNAPQTDINTKETASVNISKFDEDVKTSMQEIALNTFNTVQILNQMLEISKPGASSTLSIPTVRQATTGK